jgi:hypothetical protein
MGRIAFVTPVFVALLGAWTLLNGLLHDGFVLGQGRKYDRDLLRLLLDGHVLITSGLVLLLASFGIWKGEVWGALLGLIICASMLLYCGMIFPFLKSYGMMGLHLIGIVLLITFLIQHKAT